jgi:5'-3' exonuclease
MRYNNKEEIFIYTNDRDFSQLLNHNITILFANINTPITKKNFFFSFNYHYSNALLMKVICGDVSDNIKGIQGIKETTLIKHFPDIQFKNITVREICKQADKINKDRVANKQKPLKVFVNLLNNIDRLKKNHRLVNLEEPFLNDEAVEELEQLDMPLSPEGRSSENLYKMMMEDEFLTIYKSTFVNYVQPFYSVIMNEKQILKEYEKKDG